MSIYTNIDNFKIERCNVIAKLLTDFELVEYSIRFDLEKQSYRDNLYWEIVSPMKGFELLRITDKDHKPITDFEEQNQNNGIVKIKIPLDRHINTQNKCSFSITYRNKLEAELISQTLFFKTYGIILTRSFGSECLEYNLTIRLESKFYFIKSVIPRFDFKRLQKITFTGIPTQKPSSAAIVCSMQIEKTFFILGFILSALGGYYIPIWFTKLLNLLKI